MILLDDVRAAFRDGKRRVTHYILSHRIRARHPTLNCDPSVIWNYPFGRRDAIEIGEHVTVMPNCEIIVFPTTRFSANEGRLVLGDRAVIGTGANIRAAGGRIQIGRGSGIGQNSVVVAVNHRAVRGVPYLYTPWDDRRSGVTVGDNVWVGANCTLLPGITIGDNSLIAAGSVVTRDVPANEIWGGVPARLIKPVPEGDAS